MLYVATPPYFRQCHRSYEGQAKLDAAQGKASNTRHSGRFNATDIVTTPPELRWANERYHGGQGKKHILYDDLTLTQWAVGQLTNVHQMKDPGVMRQALLQTILALKDATSLPWQAVRSAWATSMHELEEGSLTWADATQWALNRLIVPPRLLWLALTSPLLHLIPITHSKRRFVNSSMKVLVLMTLIMELSDIYVYFVQGRVGI